MHDEDIDIDIDLTASHAEEDYMLEDSLPQQSVNSELMFEASAAPSYDDLMVDGDDEGFEVNQFQTEFIPHDQSQSMANEEPAQHFSAHDASEPYIQGHDALDMDQFEITSTKDAEQEEDEANHPQTQNNLQSQDDAVEAATSNDGSVDRLDTATTDPKAHTSQPDVASPPPASPHYNSTAPTASERPNGDPKGHYSQPTGESRDATPRQDKVDTFTAREDDEEPNNHPEETKSTVVAEVFAAPEILVTYQETEYALFSTSELDDPDSYFLSDMSILESPISLFLKDIRNVIREDLADEDELCLSIAELGLDIEEVSCSPHYSEKRS